MARACPACKSTVTIDSASHCTSCGASLDGATAVANAERGFWAENWLWIVAPVVIVAIVILLLFLFLRSEGDSGFNYKIY